jgi:hypothetical protein
MPESNSKPTLTLTPANGLMKAKILGGSSEKAPSGLPIDAENNTPSRAESPVLPEVRAPAEKAI